MIHDELDEIYRHIAEAKIALENIELATTARKLRDAWERYLYSFHRAMGKIITSSLSRNKSRAWGYRLKNNSTTDDMGLVFLREARAHCEHGLTPFAQFSDPRVELEDGLMAFEGSNSLTMTNCSYNGVPTGDFTLIVKNGKLERLIGQTTFSIGETPASIRLQDIYSSQKNKSFPVPTKILNQTISSDAPFELAKTSFTEIQDIFDDYKRHYS